MMHAQRFTRKPKNALTAAAPVTVLVTALAACADAQAAYDLVLMPTGLGTMGVNNEGHALFATKNLVAALWVDANNDRVAEPSEINTIPML